jgi:hypothetical protein
MEEPTDQSAEGTTKAKPKTIPLHERLAHPIDDACAMGGFSRSKAYELIKDNKLRSVKRAGRRLILHADLVAFLTEEGS